MASRWVAKLVFSDFICKHIVVRKHTNHFEQLQDDGSIVRETVSVRSGLETK